MQPPSSPPERRHVFGRGLPETLLSGACVRGIVLLAICLGLPTQATGRAEQLKPTHSVFNGFIPSETYVAEVDGTPSSGAQIMVDVTNPGLN